MMFDSHCHVQFRAFKDDSAEVIKRSLDKKIGMIIVGSQNSTSQRAVEFAQKYSNGVWAAIGLHPIHLVEQEINEEEISFKSREEKFDHDFYKNLAQQPKVVGIGETGLDYYHQSSIIPLDELKKKQADNFIQHCCLADELNLPMIVHCREAHADQIELIKNVLANGGLKKRGVIHCHTGDWTEAEQYLQLGFFIGFTGVINFPPKKNNPQPTLNILEAVKKIPLDRLLIETDAPYLAPPPHRGERNEPAFVEFVAQKVAEIKGISFEEVAKQTVKNTEQLFNISLKI